MRELTKAYLPCSVGDIKVNTNAQNNMSIFELVQLADIM